VSLGTSGTRRVDGDTGHGMGRAPEVFRHPPTVWAALARAGQWKSWALLLLLALCLGQSLVMLRLVRREPDIVLIAPDGQSTYVPRSVAGQALVRFLEEQRQRPGDVTVVHFTRDFLQHFFAVHPSAYEASFAEALGSMAAPLRERLAREAQQTKLLERVRVSGTRATVELEALDIVERTEGAVRLEAVLVRRTVRVPDDAPVAVERLRVGLVESIVPRTAAHPDGLLVAHLTTAVEPAEESEGRGQPEAASHAP
jgi:hypothetical protein